MAYPADYQEAEHRRALSSLLNDLESLKTNQAEPLLSDEPDLCSPRPTQSSQQPGSPLEGAEVEQDNATPHIRSTHLFDLGLTPHSAN